ncbi:uncharacterized protein LOC112899166 isoform X2 [Panicum hallii]|uniref:uncharacterized protein LOC112899166 isoform X2 n=1 Tax=Panicum hallii TaxID=206008 RepID=UPI000DF4D74A|nr:uncharacterized protein LOC112899166 isoform X2 [Panicum hallii]
MSRPSSPILISDDEKEPAAAPVAAVQGAKDEQAPVAVAEGSNDGDGIETPSWLPDGFEIEGYYERDGTFKATAYICPVSGLKFAMMREVLDYCCSDGMERAIAGKETLQDKTTLQGKYAWLRQKHGWVLEIRAGGENFSKMFKLASKNEVLRYIDEAELPEYVNGDCDTSSEDNIIAQLEFSINSLPPGWVKETTFRKCSDGIRKDTFYTDPITKKVFRSLKSAEQYFTSGEPVGAHVPIMSVTDMYYFDRCTDMLPCLASRLKMEGTGDQKCEGEGQTSRHGEEDEKGMIYGDVNKEHDEDEWHGDDEKDEVHYGDGKEEEDNEDALNGDDAEEEDEQEALHGDNNKNNEERGTDRYRSITELYKITTQVTGCSLTSTEK